jgi:hypothetical protein
MMKNKFYFMLKSLYVIFSAILFSGIVMGQNVKRNIVGGITEKKGEKSEYIVHNQGDRFVLYNKKNSLMIYESDFEKRRDYVSISTIVKFDDRSKIENLVFKIIAPFYRDVKSKYSDDILSFDINLYSKTDGKVCELSFSYDQYANIPFSAIEKLENEILGSNLKLEFDPNNYFVKDVLWINYHLSVSAKRMKERLKAENK